MRVLSRNISINNLNEKITINQIPLNDKKNSNLEMYESELWTTGRILRKYRSCSISNNPNIRTVSSIPFDINSNTYH